MNKKVKRILVSVILLAVICVLCPLLWLYSATKPYTKVINSNWGIELPNDGARDIYSYSVPSPHGDGIRYHVIDYEIGNESKRVQKSVLQLEQLFRYALKPTEEQISYVDGLIKETGINDDVLTDWGKCSLIYQKQEDHSELFLFYWMGTGTLYAVESFY